MSAQEIIEHLANLSDDELRQVKIKAEQVALSRQGGRSLREVLLGFAGTAEGLPSDMAENHDHYIHGLKKSGR